MEVGVIRRQLRKTLIGVGLENDQGRAEDRIGRGLDDGDICGPNMGDRDLRFYIYDLTDGVLLDPVGVVLEDSSSAEVKLAYLSDWSACMSRPRCVVVMTYT